MSPTEIKLRAALTWARFQVEHDGVLDKIPHTLDYVPIGPVKVLDRTTRRPHLRWKGEDTRFQTSRLVTVSTTPGGRVLRVVDTYADHHSATTEIRLPREFWPETPMPEVVK